VLFLWTCLTTLLAGTMFSGARTFDAYRARREPFAWVLSGVPFAATLLGILVVHEFGHYFTARARGAAVSLPYFIPAPPFIFMAAPPGPLLRLRSRAPGPHRPVPIDPAQPLGPPPPPRPRPPPHRPP